MIELPAARPVPVGESTRITERQDEPEHLRRLRAYSHYYQVAQRWRRFRALGTFILAAAGPLLALFVPATTDLVAAAAAGWLVLGRTLLSWMDQRSTREAVKVHELYDVLLFHLPWNSALVGRRPIPDDIANAARHITDDEPYRNWYSIDLGTTPWPADVLLCQRQSAVWSRRDHRAYAATVFTLGAAWFLIGVAVSITRDLSLADYLIKIFLPSSPAFLDSLELAYAHRQHATAREQIETKIHDLWSVYATDSTNLTGAACREIQDAAYLLRRDGPRVPNAFYKLRRERADTATKAGTDAIIREGFTL
jgi:SMODS-associating 4TM effector domain